MPGRRMSVRDGNWLHSDHLRVIGPLAGVTPATVRAVLTALHAQDPGNPAVCRVRRRSRRWVPLGPGQYALALDGDVSALGDGAGREGAGREGAGREGPAALLRRVLGAEPLGDRPLRVLLHDGYAGIRMSHAVGDGRVFNALVPQLFGAGPQPYRRRTRLALVRAGIGYFGRDPRRIRALLRVPRPVLPEPGPDEPRRPWRPDPSSYYTRSTEDLLPRLREWRAAHFPGVSAAAVLFAATRAAFEECGLVPDHGGLMIPVDARRYLPGRAVVTGNFTAAQYVEPADPRDPRAVHEAIGAAMASGRPLTTLALRDVYALRSDGRVPPVPDTVRVRPAPQLTLTHIGRLDAYAGLPWACPPADRVLLSAPTPNGTDGVTVSFAELDGAIHLNVTYHRSTFDEARVRRAADLICADPVRLVSRDGGVRAFG